MSEKMIHTYIGNIVKDPELTQVKDSVVYNFDIAITPRVYSKEANGYVDGTTTFVHCALWRDQARNAVASLKRGTRVIVTGHLQQRNWTDKETNATRSRLEVDVVEIGVSLRFATAQVTKANSNGSNQGGNASFSNSNNGGNSGGWGNSSGGASGGNDSGGWGASSGGGNDSGWGASAPADELPF